MLERHVFFDRDALLLLVFPSFLFFLLLMKGIKHLIITSAEYHGPWYLPSKHILKITPWSDMDPFILVLAALSVTHKYLFLLRIVPEMHTPGICKPHSATPPPHTHLWASDIPAMHSPCCSMLFQEVPLQSEQRSEISSKPRAISYGDLNISFYFLFLASHLNWGSQ